MLHHVWVRGLPPWCEPARLLGPGEWTFEARSANATLPTHDAADLDARLRGIGIGGTPLQVTCTPPLPRAAIRAARTTDARRRRDKSPGFTRPGCRLDEEGRWSLTPEALALDLGRRAAGRTVVDAGCGCGGNTIGFARGGARVIAVERDRGRLELARHNARIYGVADRVTFLHGDVLTLLADLRADLLFVDPPWGVDWSRARTALADVPLAGFLDAPLPVWAKLPPSFDVGALPDAQAEAWYGVADGDRRRIKFLLARWGRVRAPTP